MSPIIPGVVASSDGRQPDAPTIGSASAGNASASVPFTAPTYLGKPNTNNIYTATSSPSSITGTSTTSPISVTGLSNGTAYTFTVNLRTRDTANNVIAISTNSAASNSVTPVAPPSFPPPFAPPFPPPFAPPFPPPFAPPFPPSFSDCTDDDAGFCVGCASYQYQYSPSGNFSCSPRLVDPNGCGIFTPGCPGYLGP